MDLSAVDLNLLVSLDVLLEERSVRGAARRLSLTPPAMSHQLRRIRELLGDEVLVRAGRGMVATPRAETLVEPVRALVTQAKAVLADPKAFSPSTLQRGFRLMCTDHVSTVLLPGVEQILAEEAPGVDMYVFPLSPEDTDKVSTATAKLRTGAVDVAVGVFSASPAEMRTQVLFDDRHVTVVRSGHPRIRGPELTLEAYLAEQHILVSPGGTPVGPTDRLLAAQGLQRRVARTRPNFLAAMWLVLESDALLTVSRRFVEAAAKRFPVNVLPTPLPVKDYALSMLWHSRVDGAPEDAWFRDALLRAAASL